MAESWGSWLYATIWYLPITAFVLWNWKALPFVWHIRLYSVKFKHFILRRSHKITYTQHGGTSIFEPIISTTWCPMLEMDMNLHKSNSTFFSDLDINRMHLMAALFKPVLSGRPGADEGNRFGSLNCILGAVSCHFRREIRPLEKYEIWTRVLCWDEKWLYVVSHFVSADEVAPMLCRSGGHVAPSAKVKSIEERNVDEESTRFQMEKSRSAKLIRASAISKFVFKQGRRTIAPEDVMRELKLVPAAPSVAEQQSLEYSLSNGSRTRESADWDIHRIWKENERGLKIARQFAGLDALHDTFSGDSSDALGYFSDTPW
ncbi:capsule polysaccharide biosynthesis protein [Phlyctema vagabunda]|uniref:Capsule polysaccharide biosynthesis protein n=1 Tax=Phlyctema vagabunda TaxID=108571 RepID=A0ABR4PUJ5_9HELO